MLRDFQDFLFPKICACCNGFLLKNEQVVCTACRNELPLTDSHQQNENEIEKVFYGRVRIENALALLIFEKHGIAQHLIHDLKYKGNKKVGPFLGHWVSDVLRETVWFREIELVVPVPLHKRRLRKRGYNQVEGFGKTIAKALNIPYNDRCLIKTHGSETQVLKNFTARFRNVAHSFEIDPTTIQALEGKHILLVDDIITTGATLETCSEKLLKIPGSKVSIAAMAKTR